MKPKFEYTDPHNLIVTHTVEPGFCGDRIDAYLTSYYQSRSRSGIQKALGEGGISLIRPKGPRESPKTLKPSTRVYSGDRIIVRSSKKKEPEVNFAFQTLYEDNELLVINKPAPLPVHPAGRYYFNTLQVHLNSTRDAEHFMVHRLDKETSGVLLIAKNASTCAKLVSQFALRETTKRYLAIVRGKPPSLTFENLSPILHDEKSEIKLRMRVGTSEEPGALSAETKFRVRAVTEKYSLIECFPRTGRQHQIRVHLAALGYPIVGDKLYGLSREESSDYYDRALMKESTRDFLVLDRHALHAASLEFEHPRAKNTMRLFAPLPLEMRNVLKGKLNSV